MNELYHQMTLDEWAASKNRIREMIRTAKTAFIVIGYELRRIDESEAYRLDGYESLAEFAKAEYGFEKTMTSRLMEVNKAFSEGGYSDILIEDAEGFTFTKLVEMKDLEAEDLKILRPDVKREDIRELKRLESAEPETGAADGVDELIIEFFRKDRDALNAICTKLQEGFTDAETEMAEIISPTGNRAFRKGMWMAFFYSDSVKMKNRDGSVRDLDYSSLLEIIRRIYGEAAAAGHGAWEAYYGEPAAEAPEEKTEEKNAAEAPKEKSEEENTAAAAEEKPEEESAAAAAGKETDGGTETEKTAADEQEPLSGGQKAAANEHEDAENRKEPAAEEPPAEAEEAAEEEEHVEEKGEGDRPGRPAEASEESTAGSRQEREGDPEREETDGKREGQEEPVAPAQLEEKAAEETGEKNRLAARIDEEVEAIQKDIGSGRYHDALMTAGKMCEDLKAMVSLLYE